MSSLGQWLGQWAGAWFGLAGESDPNAAVASATIRLDASGTAGAIGWIAASAAVSLGAAGALSDGEAPPSVVKRGGGRVTYYEDRALPLAAARARRRVQDEEVIAMMTS